MSVPQVLPLLAHEVSRAEKAQFKMEVAVEKEQTERAARWLMHKEVEKADHGRALADKARELAEADAAKARKQAAEDRAQKDTLAGEMKVLDGDFGARTKQREEASTVLMHALVDASMFFSRISSLVGRVERDMTGGVSSERHVSCEGCACPCTFWKGRPFDDFQAAFQGGGEVVSGLQALKRAIDKARPTLVGAYDHVVLEGEKRYAEFSKILQRGDVLLAKFPAFDEARNLERSKRQAMVMAEKVTALLAVDNPNYGDPDLVKGIELLKSCKSYVKPLCGAAWTVWSAPGKCQARKIGGGVSRGVSRGVKRGVSQQMWRGALCGARVACVLASRCLRVWHVCVTRVDH